VAQPVLGQLQQAPRVRLLAACSDAAGSLEANVTLTVGVQALEVRHMPAARSSSSSSGGGGDGGRSWDLVVGEAMQLGAWMGVSAGDGSIYPCWIGEASSASPCGWLLNRQCELRASHVASWQLVETNLRVDSVSLSLTRNTSDTTGLHYTAQSGLVVMPAAAASSVMPGPVTFNVTCQRTSPGVQTLRWQFTVNVALPTLVWEPSEVGATLMEAAMPQPFAVAFSGPQR
jgi:hypothetical protein